MIWIILTFVFAVISCVLCLILYVKSLNCKELSNCIYNQKSQIYNLQKVVEKNEADLETSRKLYSAVCAARDHILRQLDQMDSAIDRASSGNISHMQANLKSCVAAIRRNWGVEK